jgi:hypothetical protein
VLIFCLSLANRFEPVTKYQPSNEFFIGGLIGLSVLLIYYQYRDTDHRDAVSKWDLDTVVSSLAGLFALGVAVFPPAPVQNASELQHRVDVVHHICTVLFFFTRPVGPRPWSPAWQALGKEKRGATGSMWSARCSWRSVGWAW